VTTLTDQPTAASLELKTDRLILRPIVESDILSYQRYFNNYAVLRYLNAIIPWPYPDDGVQHFYREVIVPNQGKDRWFWAIARKNHEAELIGTIDLSRNGSPENRGFWLAEPFWGKGYMTEAVSIIHDFAFDNLGFSRMILCNAKGNIASRRVKEKTGATLLRVEPATFVDASLREREVWELSKSQWYAFRDRKQHEQEKSGDTGCG
jgi:ribosomal-protein-alanine N-acetyltransferase